MADDETSSQGEDRLSRVLKQAVNDVNSLLPAEQNIVLAAETSLMGDGARLDSMGVINLIIAVEGGVEREYGVHISLMDRLIAAASSQTVTLGGVRDLLRAELGSQH